MKSGSIAAAFVLACLLLSGCGGAQTGDGFDDPPPDEIPMGDAGTDAVPQDTLEGMTGPEQMPPTEQPPETPPAEVAQEAPPTQVAPPAQETDHLPEVEAKPSPSKSSVGTGGAGTYKVQSGDTLMKIAFDVYGDLYQWKHIYELNRDKISDPNHLAKGTVLTLDQEPGGYAARGNGEKYMIQKGDTLGTISNQVYGTPNKWRKIYKNNRELIKDPNKIYAGFYLYYTVSPEDQFEKPTPHSDPLAQTPAPEQAQAPAPNPSRGLSSVPMPK